MVFVPIDKVLKALEMIDAALNKRSKKITLHQLQKLCGFLNFLCRCVVPGRTFTRRLYSYTNNKDGKLKKHHHININSEMRKDLNMWKVFLNHPTAYCRPFADFDNIVTAYQVNSLPMPVVG